MRHQDVVIGAGLIAFCGVAYAITSGFAEVPPMLSQNVPPTFFPRLVLTAIALLSLVLVLAGLRKAPDARVPVRKEVYLTGGVLVGAGLLAGLLGTLPTLGLVSFGLPLLWGERRVRLAGGIAVGVVVGVYLLFSVALGLRFPEGWILERLG